jgi:ERCC4-type nuclease
MAVKTTETELLRSEIKGLRKDLKNQTRELKKSYSESKTIVIKDAVTHESFRPKIINYVQ